MRQFVFKALAALSGLILIGIGTAVLFEPTSFAASNGIVLDRNPSLLSEIRAPGGMLLISGVIILLGAIRQNIMRLSLGLAALVYGSYGLSRMWSMVSDGLPSATLTQAAVLELVLGALSLVALVILHRKPTMVTQR